MAIEKLNINEFFPIMSLEMVKKSEQKNGKEY